MEGCPCPACEAGYTRGYLHYLVKAREPTGVARCSRCTTSPTCSG